MKNFEKLQALNEKLSTAIGDELVKLAKEKAKTLNKTGTQIRLCATSNYYLLNMGGYIFIGYYYNEGKVNHFYEAKEIMIMKDGQGKEIGEFQKL